MSNFNKTAHKLQEKSDNDVFTDKDNRELMSEYNKMSIAGGNVRRLLVKKHHGYDEKGSYKNRDIKKLKDLMGDIETLVLKLGK